MNCKKLKISIKQYNGNSDNAICKITIIINNKKTYITKINIFVLTYIMSDIDSNALIQILIRKFNIQDNLLFVIDKAGDQILSDKEFGIDTYWKWENDNEN